MNKYFNSLRKTVWVASAMLILASCESDAWKDHYSTDENVPTKNLAETIESTEGAENFVQALKTTYMYNGNKQLVKTYWDLLCESQFMTVWLPSEDSVTPEEWAEYTSDDMENKDHKKIGTEFIMNHIARFSHCVGAATKGKITMLSEKAYTATPSDISYVKYQDNGMNIRCTNGILHKLDGKIEYRPNIYEYITTSPEYLEIFGKWFAQYTKSEIDEKRSVASGINDEGVMEYVDSVMIERNALMDKYGFINAEDSNYAVILPTPELWVEMYDSIKQFFEYVSVQPGRDSLQQYWAYNAMMTDMFFNMNKTTQKSANDSVVSTQFSRAERQTEKNPYHVYYKPNDEGGLFASRIDSVVCSNGVIYIVDKWPFVDSLTYRRPIRLEVEDVRLSGFTMTPRNVNFLPDGTSIPMAKVMSISKDGATQWDADFTINNYLKGKYRVKVIFYPNLNDPRPYKLSPQVMYYDPNKTKPDVLFQSTIIGSRGRPQTSPVTLCGDGRDTTYVTDVVTFPSCDYKTDNSRVTVRISSSISQSYVKDFSPTVWIDKIVLEPVIE